MDRALIIGGGIVGLSAARALVRRGWQVELLEAGALPNPEAASTDHHRLFRPHYADMAGYAARIGEAQAAREALWLDLGARHYVETGVLSLSTAPGDWTDRSVLALDQAGVPWQRLSADEVAAGGVFSGEGVRFGARTAGGALMARRILEGLIGWLDAAGAVLRPETPALAVDDAGTVTTADGRFQADVVIVAAGVGLPALVPWAAEGLVPRRSCFLYADVPAVWESAPSWVELGGDVDYWGIPPVEGLPAKMGFGGVGRVADPATERGTTAADREALLAAYAACLLPDAMPVRAEAVANFYLMAPDERFRLMRRGRVLAVSADSGHGFKFGALSGTDVADAVTGSDFAAVAARMAGRQLA